MARTGRTTTAAWPTAGVAGVLAAPLGVGHRFENVTDGSGYDRSNR